MANQETVLKNQKYWFACTAKCRTNYYSLLHMSGWENEIFTAGNSFKTKGLISPMDS